MEVTVETRTTDGKPTVDVQVDGRPVQVTDIADGVVLVTLEGGRQVRVALDGSSPAQEAAVDGLGYAVDVRTAQQAALDEALALGSQGAGGGSSIKAPMPGRVVKILVEPGQEVGAGDPVIIVEAMKMENELQADAAGTVESVAVAQGDTVDAGQVLCKIAAHAASD